VWVSDVHTGQATNVTHGVGNSWNNEWSPDARTLAFYSDRDGKAHLWLWERTTGTLHRVSPVETRGGPFDCLDWTPDGKYLVTRVLVSASSTHTSVRDPSPTGPSSTHSTVVAYGANEDLSMTHASQDAEPEDARAQADETAIAAINVQTGDVTRLVTGASVRSWRVSPDGASVM
jgi:WD40 repeat protein